MNKTMWLLGLTLLFIVGTAHAQRNKISERQPIIITSKDYAILVLGAQVAQVPLTAQDRWELAKEQDDLLEKIRDPLAMDRIRDPFGIGSGRFVTLTNTIGAISFGLVVDKKEFPRRGLIVPGLFTDSRAQISTKNLEKRREFASGNYVLGNTKSEYIIADNDGHGYAIWKIPLVKGRADAIAYISTLSSEDSLLPVWGEKSLETYVSHFTIDRPGWYYLGEITVAGYVVDSLRFEKNPYESGPSYGRPGYDRLSYDSGKFSEWRVLTNVRCDERRLLGLKQGSTISRDFSKKRSEQEFSGYLTYVGLGKR